MIEINGLVKSFGKIRALDGLDLTCAPGEMTALVGPNGSGKSTALKIIAGTMREDRGEVRIAGQLMSMHSVGLRNRISYLPQRIAFPDQATAKEILKFFAGLRGIQSESISRLTATFGFQGFERKRVAELSGGMLQRLALAVVFLPDADLYILDEATNNTWIPRDTPDSGSRSRKSWSGARVVLMSTHILREVENLAHTIAIVSGGRIVAQQRKESFVENMNRSRKMWVTMENLSDRFRNIALEMGAEDAILNCRTMTVECGQEQRIPILSALARHGADIKEFGLHEPSLEEIYQQVLADPGSESVKQ